MKEILKRFTDDDIVIEGFEVDNKTGEAKIIIKFTEPEKAGEFVRNVREAARTSSGTYQARQDRQK